MPSKYVSPEVERAQAAANRRLRAVHGTAPIPARGTIAAVTLDAAGRADTFVVTHDDGTPLYGVIPSGRGGEGVGARVAMEGKGGLIGTSYTITKVVEPYPGYAGNDTTQILSTPVIAQVTSLTEPDADGTMVTRVFATLYCIQEHYNHRLSTIYDIQVRDAESAPLPDTLPILSSPPLERVAGVLIEDLSAGDDTFPVGIQLVATSPTFDFIRTKAIVGIDDELIYYPTAVPAGDSALLTDATRGYAGTGDVMHEEGRDVTLRGITVPASGLLANHAYHVRCRARAGGRTSNWSDWVGVLTEYDTTPPTWSGAPITPTVSVVSSGLQVVWEEADTNISDLAYYEVEIARASDFSGGTELERAGNSNSYIYTAEYGWVRWFRVRAVDFTGNVSPWSNSARGYMTIPHEPQGTNVLPNPTAATNTTGWSFSTGGTGSLSRDTTEYFDAAGSFKIVETRSGIEIPLFMQSGAFAISGGQEYYLRLWLRQSGLTAGDLVYVTVNHKTSSGGATIKTTVTNVVGNQIDSAAAAWSPLPISVFFGSDKTHAEVVIGATVDNGSGTVSLWIDDMVFVKATDTLGSEAVSDLPSALRQMAPTRVRAAGGQTTETILEGSASLDFSTMFAHTTAELTITVAGAAVGDACTVAPTTAPESGLMWVGYVSDDDEVTVRLLNGTGSGINPAANTWTAQVRKLS